MCPILIDRFTIFFCISGIGGVLGFKAGFLFFLCLVDRKIRKEGRNCRRLQTAKSYLSIWVSTYILSVFDSDKWIDNSQIIEIKYGTLGFELRFCFGFFVWLVRKEERRSRTAKLGNFV